MFCGKILYVEAENCVLQSLEDKLNLVQIGGLSLVSVI